MEGMALNLGSEPMRISRVNRMLVEGQRMGEGLKTSSFRNVEKQKLS